MIALYYCLMWFWRLLFGPKMTMQLFTYASDGGEVVADRMQKDSVWRVERRKVVRRHWIFWTKEHWEYQPAVRIR